MSDHGGWPANTTSDPGCDSSNAPGSEPERTISMSTKNQRGLALSGARVLITGEIGRASCREREEGSVVEGEFREETWGSAANVTAQCKDGLRSGEAARG